MMLVANFAFCLSNRFFSLREKERTEKKEEGREEEGIEDRGA